MRKLHVFILLIALLILGCADTISPEEVIGILLINEVSSIPADNSSMVEVIGYISVDADDDKRTIKFETSAGTFTKNNEKNIEIKADDTIELNNERFLSSKVLLKSSNIVTEEVIVKAEIELFPARTSVSFTDAPPVSLELAANKFGVFNDFDSEVILTALVKSATGFPSSGSSVSFLVFDDETGSLISEPRFRDEKLAINASGQSSIVFTAGNLTNQGAPFEGDLRIECKVNGQDNINDTIVINVSSRPD